MPVLPSPRSTAAMEIAERVAAAPRDDALRALDRIDALGADLVEDRLYPREWVLFRLLGEREEGDDEPEMLVGAALRDDLSMIAERVSVAVGLTRDELEPAPIDPGDLAARWGVSARTLDRYRRAGLVARRVAGGRGGPRVVYTPAAVASFERVQRAALERAGKFSRIGPKEDARLVRAAELCRSWYRWSLNETARRLANRTGRSHEGVRQALRRADRSREKAIFPEPGPPTERERRVLSRALRRGLEPAWLADRTDRSKASVRRAVILAREEALEGWLHARAKPTFAGGADAEALLRDGPACDLPVMTNPATLEALLVFMRERETPVAVEERARVRAAHALVARARTLADEHRGSASGAAADECETCLRWASLLKAVMLRPHLRLLVETIDGLGSGRAETWHSYALGRAVLTALRAASGAVDRHDPTRGGRLAGAIGLAVQRAFAGKAAPAPVRDQAREQAEGRAEGRASRRLVAGARAPAWSLVLDPWQRELSHPGAWARLLQEADRRGRLGEVHASVIEQRFGLGGGPPRTLAQLGASLGTTPMHAALAERRAVRAMRELVRAGG